MNWKKKLKKIWSPAWRVFYFVIAAAVCFIGIASYGLSNWVMDTWGLLSVEEIIFHLKVPLEGTNMDMVWECINLCVPMASVFTIAAIISMAVTRKRRTLYLLSGGTAMMISLIVLFISGKYVYDGLNVKEYIANQKNQSTFIQDNYKDVRNTQMTFPEQKRNLIYIFLESMESTYASVEDGGAFQTNLIPELTELARNNVSFSNTGKLGGGIALPGGTWTIGAMFSQTSGLPLLIPIDGNAMGNQETFLPGVVSIGDLLEEQGYNQVLMIGSEAEFGGRKNYFEQHGDYEIIDYGTAIEEGWIPEGYRVFWGYEDSKLFENSKVELTELAASAEPFNFTMLTVDTHFPDGYVCDLCQTNYDLQYENVMACSSHQVAEFVSWIQQQPFYENTTIVISGDHLTMVNGEGPFVKSMQEGYDRRVYNAVINPAVQPVMTADREFSTLDWFPTTLASIGVQIDGDRLGLGTNLFSDKKTLLEEYGRDYIEQELNRKSGFFDNFVTDIVFESSGD